MVFGKKEGELRGKVKEFGGFRIIRRFRVIGGFRVIGVIGMTLTRKFGSAF